MVKGHGYGKGLATQHGPAVYIAHANVCQDLVAAGNLTYNIEEIVYLIPLLQSTRVYRVYRTNTRSSGAERCHIYANIRKHKQRYMRPRDAAHDPVSTPAAER